MMSSPIRRRLYRIMDIILRVPPLFIMDSIFLSNMKIVPFPELLFNLIFTNTNSTNSTVFHLLYDKQSMITTTLTSHHHDSNLNSIQFQAILNNASAIIMALGDYYPY